MERTRDTLGKLLEEHSISVQGTMNIAVQNYDVFKTDQKKKKFLIKFLQENFSLENPVDGEYLGLVTRVIKDFNGVRNRHTKESNLIYGLLDLYSKNENVPLALDGYSYNLIDENIENLEVRYRQAVSDLETKLNELNSMQNEKRIIYESNHALVTEQMNKIEQLEKTLEAKLAAEEIVKILRDEIEENKKQRRNWFITLLLTICGLIALLTCMYTSNPLNIWANSVKNIPYYMFLTLIFSLVIAVVNVILKNYNYYNHVINEKTNKINNIKYYISLSVTKDLAISKDLGDMTIRMLEEVFKPIKSNWNKEQELSGINDILKSTKKMKNN